MFSFIPTNLYLCRPRHVHLVRRGAQQAGRLVPQVHPSQDWHPPAHVGVRGPRAPATPQEEREAPGTREEASVWVRLAGIPGGQCRHVALKTTNEMRL